MFELISITAQFIIMALLVALMFVQVNYIKQKKNELKREGLEAYKERNLRHEYKFHIYLFLLALVIFLDRVFSMVERLFF
jgi:hypothetical protein